MSRFRWLSTFWLFPFTRSLTQENNTLSSWSKYTFVYYISHLQKCRWFRHDGTPILFHQCSTLPGYDISQMDWKRWTFSLINAFAKSKPLSFFLWEHTVGSKIIWALAIVLAIFLWLHCQFLLSHAYYKQYKAKTSWPSKYLFHKTALSMSFFTWLISSARTILLPTV